MTRSSLPSHSRARLLALLILGLGVVGAGCGSALKVPSGDGGGGGGAGNSADGSGDVPQGAGGAAGGASGSSGAGTSGTDASGGMDGAAACFPLFHDCALDTECCAPNRCLNITGTPKCQVEGPPMPDAGSGDGGATACADLAARAAALLVKDCTMSDQCAVTTVYNCCTVYTGIRADAKAAFESAQAAHDRACPDLRGCQCQDHTETNELVPMQQPPLPVSATCDLGKCAAHQK